MGTRCDQDRRCTIARTIRELPATDEVLRLIEASLDDDKAEGVVVIDLAGKTGFADYMVIASGRSDRHVGAMADHLVEKLKGLGLPTVPTEGTDRCDWVLLDAGDVIVHLFRPEVRDFYNLEKLWSQDSIRPEAAQVEMIA
jgi:ribosome-associated protein